MKRRGFLIAVLAVGLGHILVLFLLPRPLLASNCFQVLAPALAVALCLYKAQHAPTQYFRLLWAQLVSAFFIWMSAQIWFTLSIRSDSASSAPSGADFLWMLFAFPLFLVTSNKQETSHDWVAWLDIGQASISVAILSVLMFSQPALVTTGTAYDIQATALLLACAIRYSVSVPGAERVFFRNLALCAAVYGAASALGYLGPAHGFPEGGIVDVCWSAPFLIFCLLVLHSDRRRPGPEVVGYRATSLRTRLHGIGAFSLALMSIGVSGFLTMHRPGLGVFSLTVAFLLFAARTSIREVQLQVAHERLETASLHDALTGFANRKLLLEELSRCFAARKPGRDFALLFVDLDRFKVINDSLGHAYGDRLLVHVGSVIRSAVGGRDIVARLGGDEFAVLVEDIDEVGTVQATAAALLVALQAPVTLEGRVSYLSASIGMVMGRAAGSGDEMLRNADCAMYEAKALGKNRATVFTPAMLSKANGVLLLETDLNRSLNEGRIRAWYQPIYSIATDTIYGFEALARWQHPVRGLVSPADFIPVAEDTGLIIELGKQVLRQACSQVREWNAEFGANLAVSVNISACQFSDPNLVHDIQQILWSTHLDPRLLKLEITESVLIDGLQSVKGVLDSARALGIEIYLDDFGTGYSSLSYLLDFPFDAVKIDRSFIRNLEKDERRMELVRMIVQLTNNLGKRAIPEGVETYGELDCLRNLGCDLVQGFLLSKPLDPDSMRALLADSSSSFLQTYNRAQVATLIHGSSPARSAATGQPIEVAPLRGPAMLRGE